MKTAEQQAALMLLGIREQLVVRRTQLSNMIRGHAAEFGLIEAKGLDKLAHASGALILAEGGSLWLPEPAAVPGFPLDDVITELLQFTGTPADEGFASFLVEGRAACGLAAV